MGADHLLDPRPFLCVIHTKMGTAAFAPAVQLSAVGSRGTADAHKEMGQDRGPDPLLSHQYEYNRLAHCRMPILIVLYRRKARVSSTIFQ
jgi:hypothetical protein